MFLNSIMDKYRMKIQLKLNCLHHLTIGSQPIDESPTIIEYTYLNEYSSIAIVDGIII